jgi:hypothetical protein
MGVPTRVALKETVADAVLYSQKNTWTTVDKVTKKVKAGTLKISWNIGEFRVTLDEKELITTYYLRDALDEYLKYI